MKRINLRAFNKRCIEALAMSGAFDSLGNHHRAQFFAESDNINFIERLIRYASSYQAKLNSIQMSIFDDSNSSDEDNGIEFKNCKPW